MVTFYYFRESGNPSSNRKQALSGLVPRHLANDGIKNGPAQRGSDSNQLQLKREKSFD